MREEPGFLEVDDGEETYSVSQWDIAEAADIASAAKHFDVRLEQFGPYCVDYSRNGRHLLLGGRGGHVAAFDWQTKALQCEFNVMETVRDAVWLHAEAALAVAQRQWLFVYDGCGVELNCLKAFRHVITMRFLPQHLLLATANAAGFLQFLDVSVGAEVAALCTRGGRPAAMAQNPASGVVHLGHGNGTVTLWTPNSPQPAVRLLCHRGAVRDLCIDHSGTYMATVGLDRRLRLWDLRTYGALQGLTLPLGGAHLCYSQRGLLGVTCGDVVQVFPPPAGTLPPKPYLCHRLSHPPHSLRFCPYEDVLGVGHGGGFSSLLVPGAGEANFDALEANPYRSRKQRQEWEVKALLEKIPSQLLTLDAAQLQQVDTATLEQKRTERIERLGFDPDAPAKFRPRHKAKGSGALHRKRKVAHQQQRAAIQRSVEQREQRRRDSAAGTAMGSSVGSSVGSSKGSSMGSSKGSSMGSSKGSSMGSSKGTKGTKGTVGTCPALERFKK